MTPTAPQTVGLPEAGEESLAMPAMAIEAASGAQTRKQNAGEPSLFPKPMKDTPESVRDATWSRIRNRLTGLRQQTYEAFTKYGPCTTMDLASKSGISPFVVRPRTTELHALGLVEISGHTDHARSREGIYRAVPLAEAFKRLESEIRHIPIQTSFL